MAGVQSRPKGRIRLLEPVVQEHVDWRIQRTTHERGVGGGGVCSNGNYTNIIRAVGSSSNIGACSVAA